MNIIKSKIPDSIFNILMLFTSSSTLVCCALPALLVSFGLGTTLVGIVSYFPQLVWISLYKAPIFAVAGSMLLFNGIVLIKNKTKLCPIDSKLRAACIKGRKWSIYLYCFSLAIYLIGFTFAFIIPLMFN